MHTFREMNAVLLIKSLKADSCASAMPLLNICINETRHCKLSCPFMHKGALLQTRAYSDCSISLVLGSLCHLRSFWKTAGCQREFPSPTSPSVRMVWREQGRTAGSAPTSPSETRYIRSFLLQCLFPSENDTTEISETF